MNTQRTLTIGADPELFLVDPNSGKFISSIDRIGGTKDQPFSIDGGCAVQEDNVAVEFNIPPSKTVQEFIDSCDNALNYLTWAAGNQGLNLMVVPSAKFDDDQLQDARALQFGCEPDFNAWQDGKRNPRPKAKNTHLRSAGGHIHVGGVGDLDPKEVVRFLDWTIGVPMVLHDEDVERRQLYGRAGAYRPKSYGLEYRTPSNAWLAKRMHAWVFGQVHKAVADVDNGRSISKEIGEMIQQAINTSDRKLAQELVGLYEQN